MNKQSKSTKHVGCHTSKEAWWKKYGRDLILVCRDEPGLAADIFGRRSPAENARSLYDALPIDSDEGCSLNDIIGIQSDPLGVLEKLHSEHERMVRRHGGKFFNRGWATGDDFITSKTTIGRLHSAIDTETGKISHEWLGGL